MKIRMLIVLAAAALAACATPDTGTDMPEAELTYEATGWTVRTLPELSNALEDGEVKSSVLTYAYLERIALMDRAGARLQAILAVNPDALDQAKASDGRSTKLM